MFLITSDNWGIIIFDLDASVYGRFKADTWKDAYAIVTEKIKKDSKIKITTDGLMDITLYESLVDAGYSCEVIKYNFLHFLKNI